jgi:ArsR family transcriptional regulator
LGWLGGRIVLQMSVSAISHQLRKLKDRGIVQNRREGSTIYYSIKENKLDSVLQFFKEFNYLPTMEGV